MAKKEPEPSYIFEPDPEGNNIDFVANMTAIHYVNRITNRIQRQFNLRHFNKDCTCPTCNQRLKEIVDDNVDRANWVAGKGRWGKDIVIKPSKKKGKPEDPPAMTENDLPFNPNDPKQPA